MGAEPIQLPLFPDQAILTRVRPERNELPFYRLPVWPDLFGRALLARQWGRIGTHGRVCLDPYPDIGAAINTLAHPRQAPAWLSGQPRMITRPAASGTAATKRGGQPVKAARQGVDVLPMLRAMLLQSAVLRPPRSVTTQWQGGSAARGIALDVEVLRESPHAALWPYRPKPERAAGLKHLSPRRA
jgi:predicted DNA-binding WGR domain protein